MIIYKKIKQRSPLRYLLAAILLWLLLIFILSTQNGPQTTNTSEKLATTIARVLYQTQDTVQINAIHTAIRRYAHVALFLVLGLMIGIACTKVRRNSSVWRRFFTGYAFLLFCSFFDEWHKQFIDGRHNHIEDVLLNVRGCTIGLGLIITIYIIRNQINNRKTPHSLN